MAKSNKKTIKSNTEGELSFEEAFTELNEAVERLEAGNLSLPEALLAFESGMTAYHACEHYLSEVEQKVYILTTNPPKPTSAPKASSPTLDDDPHFSLFDPK